MIEPEAKREPGESEGGSGGAEHLPELYSQLRSLAANKLAREQPGQTLQATALVHEAFIRLEKSGDKMGWRDERHYFSAAAESMRRILIEKARAKNSRKRGGGRVRTELRESRIAEAASSDEVLAVDEALEKLAIVDPTAAELVQLRYFGGLTAEEAAVAMGTSKRTADRTWAFARAWLYRELDRSS